MSSLACLTYAVSFTESKHDVPKTKDNPNPNNCDELLWKMNTKEKPWTVTLTRRRTSQKTDVKKKGRREDQDEEGKRKSSKLIAYLTVKIVKLSKRKCNALSNGQIGVSKMSIVFGLNIIQISAKFMCNKLMPYLTKFRV